MLTIETVYVPHAERTYRDEAVRPARIFEDDPATIDRWEEVPDASPVATYWRAATIPDVTIICWTAYGTFSVRREADGVRTSIDASTWDEAVRGAYAYASWSNDRYMA